MVSSLFEVCRMLEAARLHYFIEREPGDRALDPDSDCIRLTVTLVGERMEIDVFADNHIEISRFRGSETIQGGSDLLRALVKRENEGC